MGGDVHGDPIETGDAGMTVAAGWASLALLSRAGATVLRKMDGAQAGLAAARIDSRQNIHPASAKPSCPAASRAIE